MAGLPEIQSLRVMAGLPEIESVRIMAELLEIQSVRICHGRATRDSICKGMS